MTYLNQLSGHQMSIIGPSIEAAQRLKPGQEVSVKFASPEFTTKVRFWIYSYLHINNLKSIYTLRQISPIKFVIRRNEEERGVVIEPPLNLAENFVIECLLDVVEESEALRCITESDLSDQSKLHALSEWKRINS